jgi:hypothetical protein
MLESVQLVPAMCLDERSLSCDPQPLTQIGDVHLNFGAVIPRTIQDKDE